MKDFLPSIAEAVKLDFYGPKTIRLNDSNDIVLDGFIAFDAYINYEVIGAFLQNDRVKVVVKIYRVQCYELVEDYVMVSFQRELQRLIVKKIPEADGYIDICPIKKLINEE